MITEYSKQKNFGMHKAPRSTKLASYSGVWRVDGIGLVHPSTKLGTGITVHFSKIDPKFQASPFDHKDPIRGYLQLTFNSSWLRSFTPGSVWINGVLTHTPNNISQHFTIDTRQCIYTQISKIDTHYPVKSLIPKSYLNVGKNYSQLALTKVAFVPIINPMSPPTKWLIIPTAELFRFYLGHSSRLISHALTGTLDQLIDLDSVKLEDKKISFFDRTGILSERERAHIGRIFTCTESKEAFFGPHKFLSAAVLNGSDDPLYIDSRFPFGAKTNLQVAGKRVRLLNTETRSAEWAIYVMEIRDCTHPFGFDCVETLITESDPCQLGGRIVGNVFRSNPAKRPKEDETEINDKPADGSRRPIKIEGVAAPSDPLDKIRFIKTKLKRTSHHSLVLTTNNTPGSGYTFENTDASGNGTGNIRTEVVDSKSEPICDDIEKFIKAIQILRLRERAKKCTITTQLINNKLIKRIDNDVITELPNLGKWSLIQKNNSKTESKTRRIVWLQIKGQQHHIHLIEMELKDKERARSTLMIFQRESNELSEQDLNNLFKLTAARREWPMRRHRWENSEHQSIADELFARFYLTTIAHPFVPKTIFDTDQDSSNNQKKREMHKVSAELWECEIYREISHYLC